MTPGPKFSAAMSEIATSRSARSRAAGSLRLSVRLRSGSAMPPPKGGRRRLMSTRARDSTLYTSAPRNASVWPKTGPSQPEPKLQTRIPSSGSARAILRHSCLLSAAAVARASDRGEDLVVVLAEQRRRSPRPAGALRQADRRADIADVAECGVLELKDEGALG